MLLNGCLENISDSYWQVDQSESENIPLCKREAGKNCPRDWYLNNDMCYQWFSSPHMKRNWDSARMYCDSIGAKILEVHSQENIKTHIRLDIRLD